MRQRLLGALGAALLVASCAAPQGDFKLIEHPDQPIEREGVTIYAPAEGSWSLGEHAEGAELRLLLLKDFGPPAPAGKVIPTTYVALQIVRLPVPRFEQQFPSKHAALEAYAKDTSKPATGRFTDLTSETSWGTLHGQEFVRISRSAEERDNPQEPSAVLRMDTHITFLFHPNQPATAIRVEVSQRCRAGEQMPSLAALEESFLAKLAFR